MSLFRDPQENEVEKTDLRRWERVQFTLADSPILVGAIPPWLPRLWVAKRVGTGARTLPNVDYFPGK
ncbi:hypothetical protein PROH_20165 [Prochlorothrix hollandica PCC 9006 = CALU 1027]|uniref:Uncharacterized protein n=1 Tax=Prochlorothrix hollandica PCC 9006 = CALU 1027 TaxID=317619 RepID=A0A0M2PUL4_PROHO|nr:hypothetical protein PROH_20165 [Prochlorothrix hollandica PCC 9006 = CALU 1027]